MKKGGLVILAMALVASCYIDAGAGENKMASVPFKTFFFLRKIAPYSSSRRKMDSSRNLPAGAHKRMDFEGKFSPFHSVLVIKKPLHEISGMNAISKGESAESFIKDFFISQLQHMNAMENSYMDSSSRQFNTEKIYKEMYKTKVAAEPKEKPQKKAFHLLGDEIDSIIAKAAKEITTDPENVESKSSIGKTIKRTRKQVGKKFKKAQGAIRKGVKINWYTIFLFIVVCLISGFAGYSIRGKNQTEHFVPLDK